MLLSALEPRPGEFAAMDTTESTDRPAPESARASAGVVARRTAERSETFSPRQWAWLVGLALAYCVFTVAQWSLGYIDFGDGNYMYIAWRIAEGDVVYRDILAPQPPAHLFVGAAIYKLAEALNMAQPVFAFRAFSLLLHLATFAMVVRLAQRAWGRPGVAVVAGAIFLWFPIGFWWSMAYQSEPLELAFLLAMMLAALRGDLKGDIAAGIFAACAALTNATAAPFLLVLILYMLARAPLRAARMALPCVALAGAVVAAMEIYADGMFLDVVVGKQVGTYPGDSIFSREFFGYAWGKLVGQGSKVLALEGFFWFAALLGVARYLRESPLPSVERGGLAWFCLATMGSIVFVTKGGTMDYIFSLGEPAIAVLAAGELCAWRRRLGQVPREHAPALAVGGIVLGLVVLLPGLNFHMLLWQQQAYEAPEQAMVRPGTGELARVSALTVRNDLLRHGMPGEPVLAPPFYAFLARRPLFGHFSELFIWNITYWNDRRAGDPEGPGWRKAREIEAAIRARELPIVILEMDQTGTVPEIMLALQEHYVPLRTELLPTLNTRLGQFVPRTAGGDATRRAEEDRRWREWRANVAGGNFAAWWDIPVIEPEAAKEP